MKSDRWLAGFLLLAALGVAGYGLWLEWHSGTGFRSVMSFTTTILGLRGGL
jgi:hypothetical protein